MMLTPRESEKLLVYVAAGLARRRQARGLKLNVPESVALITEALLEGARATTCTPGVWNIHRMLQAAEGLPVNWGLLGKGNSSEPEPLIPFEGARFRQRTSITVAATATLMYWEILSPGRTAVGEGFAYDCLEHTLRPVARRFTASPIDWSRASVRRWKLRSRRWG